MNTFLWIVSYIVVSRIVATSTFTLIYGYEELWKVTYSPNGEGRNTPDTTWGTWLIMFAEFIGAYWLLVWTINGPAKLTGLAREKFLEYYTTKSNTFNKEQGQLSYEDSIHGR